MNVISFVVGRFQPFHFGHVELIENAIKISKDKGLTVIFIGSSNSEETDRNPFNFYKRVDMITKSYGGDELKNLAICPLPDFESDDDWVNHISHCLKAISEKNRFTEVEYKAVVCDKDQATKESNNLFDRIENCEIVRIQTSVMINATDIREMIFKKNVYPNEINNLIPYSTISVLNEFL